MESKILPENQEEFHEKHPSAPQQIAAQLQFQPMPKPLTEVKVRVQTWPNGKETIPEETFPIKEVFLPLSLKFFKEIETQKKMYEYLNYLLSDIQHFWLVNTKTNIITHMAEVGLGEEHNDKRLDGSLKQKYKYPIFAYYQLNHPIP